MSTLVLSMVSMCFDFCEALTNLPSRKLRYPILGKGTSSSNTPWVGICGIYFDPREVYCNNFGDYCDSVQILRVCVPSKENCGNHEDVMLCLDARINMRRLFAPRFFNRWLPHDITLIELQIQNPRKPCAPFFPI